MGLLLDVVRPPSHHTGERIPVGYVVKDATGQALAYVYARETRTTLMASTGRWLHCSNRSRREPLSARASSVLCRNDRGSAEHQK